MDERSAELAQVALTIPATPGGYGDAMWFMPCLRRRAVKWTDEAQSSRKSI